MTKNPASPEIKSVSLVFPHQLFGKNPCIDHRRIIYLVEEYLYFRQYKFHKQKIAFHRATMKFYQDYLQRKGYEVVYVDSSREISDIRNLTDYLSKQGVKEVYYCDVIDDWLGKRIKKHCKLLNIEIHEFESPMFINTKEDISTY
jgi:deoxyribodipyrimidine photolyase-related protein